MKTAIVSAEGVSALQFGAYHAIPKLDRETSDDYEQRTWQKKIHVDHEGNVVLPPMALKNAIYSTAKFLSIPVPGKGKALYTKNFLSGIMCVEPAVISRNGKALTIEDCEKVGVFGNSKGQRGMDGPRVMKYFPTIQPVWETTLEYIVLDDAITVPVFERVITEVGKINGFGVFRPQSGGYYGRFIIKNIEWKD